MMTMMAMVAALINMAFLLSADRIQNAPRSGSMCIGWRIPNRRPSITTVAFNNLMMDCLVRSVHGLMSIATIVPQYHSPIFEISSICVP